MEFKFEIGQYVSTKYYDNSEIKDRKVRKKRGEKVAVYLVNFNKTRSATSEKYKIDLEWWYREDELTLKAAHSSYLEIWIAAIKRLIKNVTGYEIK